MSTAARDCIYEGQGRPRKGKLTKTDLPSHYQFAHWDYEDGKRIAVPVGGVRSDKRAEYPLISTTILNEGTGTETLIWLHFDLDYKRADKKWIRDEKIHWPLIAEALAREAPMVLGYLSHVVRSSGGRGLSLALAISPLELIDETWDVQKLAFKVQAMIIQILNHHGMGADEGARGLKRLMPNMFREEHVLDQAEFVQATIQRRRPRVLQNLFYTLRYHPTLRPPKKRDRHDLLWPDQRVEKPLARLYTNILDEAGPWGSVQLSASMITAQYGISKNTVYKLLFNPPKWLGVARLPGEGYRLTIRPVRELTDRAYDLLLESPARGGEISFVDIKAPERVEKGKRNHWLVSVILSCKWKGLSQAETRALLSLVISRIPGWQKSQSLTRGLGAILRSLFHHRSSLRGQSPDLVLPVWLIEAMQSTKSKNISQKFYKKGSRRDLTPSPSAASVSSEQQDPSSSGASFSLPSSYIVSVGLGAGQVVEGQMPVFDRRRFGEAEPPCPSSVAICLNPQKDGFAQDSGEVSSPGLVSSSFLLDPDGGGGDSFRHLSGSALSSAFSKALMKSSLPAAEKARILTKVTGILDSDGKEQMRRMWLSKLLN